MSFLEDFAGNLRPEDARELYDFTGLYPDEAMRRSIAVSRSWDLWFYKGSPVILYGASDDPQDALRGSVWLVATTEVHRVSKGFLRATRGILAHYHTLYPHGLHAWADSRNSMHLRWLEAAGFTLEDSGGPFIHAVHSPLPR